MTNATLNATLPAKLNALPEAWLGKIFSGMKAAYGTRALDRWLGLDFEKEVMPLWARTLARFSDDPACFGLAIDDMLDSHVHPPSLPEFVALCRSHYRAPVASLALPQSRLLTPEELRTRIASLRGRFGSMVDAVGMDA